jgi:hypothetical protein
MWCPTVTVRIDLHKQLLELGGGEGSPQQRPEMFQELVHLDAVAAVRVGRLREGEGNSVWASRECMTAGGAASECFCRCESSVDPPHSSATSARTPTALFAVLPTRPRGSYSGAASGSPPTGRASGAVFSGAKSSAAKGDDAGSGERGERGRRAAHIELGLHLVELIQVNLVLHGGRVVSRGVTVTRVSDHPVGRVVENNDSTDVEWTKKIIRVEGPCAY